MNKYIVVLLMLLLASCGDSRTAGVSSGELVKTAAEEATAPEVVPLSILANAQEGTYKEGEIIVKFRAGTRTASSVKVHQAVGASLLRGLSLIGAEHLKLPGGLSVRDAINRYMQDPDVEFAEPNYIRSIRSTVPNDPLFSMQWALKNTVATGADIKMTQAWDIARGDGGTVIAVIDTGIDYTHPDLAANVWSNPGEASCSSGADNDQNGLVADCRGWNFVGKNNNPMDDNGHGTHVSGTIGAVGNNGLGIAGMIWNVKIMPLKVLDSQGIGTVADEVEAIQYAISKGARIINASFAGDAFSNTESAAISAANSAGILFVTAAGNGDINSSGSNNDVKPVYPGNYNLPNIISVAATDQADSKALFSNYGLKSVHVAAPGVSILSTVPPGLRFLFCGGSPLPGYEYCDGTSMSAPHVSGLAGLLSGYYKNFTYSQVRATIIRYVDSLPSLQGKTVSGGRINAYSALSSLLTPTSLSANTQSASEIILNWTDNAAGEDGYKIERKAPGGDFAQVGQTGPNVTTYSDEGLSPSTAYAYRVRAFNTIPADSAYSGEVSANTFPGAGPGPGPVQGGGGGGCSVGAERNAHHADEDALMIMMPLLAIILLRRAGRAKK